MTKNQEFRYLVKDSGTSKSPKSTRQRGKYFGLSKKLWGEASFVFAAMEQTGLDQAGRDKAELDLVSYMRIHVPLKLRNDRDFILAAVERGGINLVFVRYAPEELQNDRGFILDAIEKNVDALECFYLRPILLDDADFMLAAVERNADAIKYLSPELRAKDGFMLDIEVRKQNRTDCATLEREEGACSEPASKRLRF